MGQVGPYGTNEGDAWLSPDSEVQARLDADGEGKVLIHQIIDGEEKIYVTDDPKLIDHARIGTQVLGQPPTTENIPYRQLVFPGFWPKGSEPIVRRFLETKYDQNTMPPLHVNKINDTYHLIGWNPEEHPEGIGLLEAARGYGLTEEEKVEVKEWMESEESAEDRVTAGVWGEPGYDPFPDTPPGRNLPIGCKYPFAPFKSALDALRIPFGSVPPLYTAPVPEDFEVERIPWDSPEIAEAGFQSGEAWVDGGGNLLPSYSPGATAAAFSYLRDPEGDIVATWDEGRWWTPEESAAFHLMLMVPGAAGFGIGQDTPKGGIEWTDQDQ